MHHHHWGCLHPALLTPHDSEADQGKSNCSRDDTSLPHQFGPVISQQENIVSSLNVSSINELLHCSVSPKWCCWKPGITTAHMHRGTSIRCTNGLTHLICLPPENLPRSKQVVSQPRCLLPFGFQNCRSSFAKLSREQGETGRV